MNSIDIILEFEEKDTETMKYLGSTLRPSTHARRAIIQRSVGDDIGLARSKTLPLAGAAAGTYRAFRFINRTERAEMFHGVLALLTGQQRRALQPSQESFGQRGSGGGGASDGGGGGFSDFLQRWCALLQRD